MNSLISIIIPVFNAEQTLGVCLDSLLAQTHKDIEILCVVDGANDSSANMLYDYSQRDPRIVVIEQLSSGPATARNAGLTVATGKYIGFVDADDKVAPDMYEKLLAAIKKDNADLSCCAHYSVGVGETEWEVNLAECLSPLMEINDPQTLGLLLTRIPDFIWDKLFLREIIVREEICFPDGRVYGEDTVFLAKYLNHTKRIAFVSDPLYYYTAFSTGSITNTVSDAWYDIFENLKEIIYYFSGQKELEPYIGELCIRYYDRRANAILRGGDKEFKIRYLRYSFEFLDANHPGWKARMRSMDGIAYAGIKTSLPLMRLAMMAPASLKERAGERALRR